MTSEIIAGRPAECIDWSLGSVLTDRDEAVALATSWPTEEMIRSDRFGWHLNRPDVPGGAIVNDEITQGPKPLNCHGAEDL